MANYKDVELSSVGTVRVYRPPNMRINRMVSKKYKYPPQPTATVEMYRGKDLPSDQEVILLVEGPEYDAWKAECDAIDQERFSEIGEWTNLYALKDIVPPEDFDVDAEFGDFARAMDDTWKPRPGTMGRKLDYIEWVVLGFADDEIKVGEALNELMGISQEVVDEVKASFQGDLEGAAA